MRCRRSESFPIAGDSRPATPARNVLGSLPCEPLLDFQCFVRTEVDVGGAGDSVHLSGAANACDRTGYSGILQGPRDGHFARRGIAALADDAQRFDQPQIVGKQRFLEVRTVFAPIVFGERSNPLASHGAA